MNKFLSQICLLKKRSKSSNPLSNQANKYFSKVRMFRYHEHGGKLSTLPIDIYMKNIEISQHVIGMISIFEIVLKNKIDAVLSPLNYLDSSSGILSKQQYGEIASLDKKINKRSDAPRDIRSRRLSNLTLGFWCSLFEDKKLWSKHLCKIFEKEIRQTYQITHSKILRITRDVRELRNNIAHHDRILFKKDKYLGTTVDEMVEITLNLIDSKDIEFKNYMGKELLKKKRAIEKIKGSFMNM